ncbi:MAG: hypothetical protein KME54_23270 [Tolypothrix brevis GSE-NOS-MK-07-07A]|jgi:hypothetical protein|nr:hypothetical protein [Tolypothrix brevis GSE-NOS-MK-07-07A]
MQIKQFPRGSPTTTDYLIFESDTATLSCLINELPTATTTSSSTWTIINDNYVAQSSEKIIASVSNITITLPENPSNQDIEIFNVADSGSLLINLNGKKFEGLDYTSGITLESRNYARILYLSSDLGWLQLPGSALTILSEYSTSGLVLWLEGGSLIDKSGNENNASAIGTSPTITSGLDSKNILRWDGTDNQELQIAPFLTSATEATIYVVFTNLANNNYNLIRTKNIDDYWRFSSNGNGYFGTFLSGRIDGYPSEMPLDGSHLISIHAKANNYEVLLDNVGKGVQDLAFDPGDRFRISTNEKNFNGDIALILVYQNWIDKNSSEHEEIIATIKANYPSLII